jgi:hypothetical protein
MDLSLIKEVYGRDLNAMVDEWFEFLFLSVFKDMTVIEAVYGGEIASISADWIAVVDALAGFAESMFGAWMD